MNKKLTICEDCRGSGHELKGADVTFCSYCNGLGEVYK